MPFPLTLSGELVAFDDGNGENLYAIGWNYGTGVAGFAASRWDAGNWTNVSSGLVASSAFHPVVHDDGTGPALYAVTTDAMASLVVARFDGTSWTSIGGGFDALSMNSTASFDDGTGPGLYVSGSFPTVNNGATPAPYIARWNGTTWTGAGNPGAPLTRMTVFDPGSGSKLYGISAIGALLEYDGSTWSTVVAASHLLEDLVLLDDGTGPALYVTGEFTGIGGIAAPGAARWDGSAWTALAPAPLSGRLAAGGMDLFVVGTDAPNTTSEFNGMARWDGSSWRDVGGGLIATPGNSSVTAILTRFAAGRTDAVIAGAFRQVGGIRARGVARWDGSTWHAFGDGIGGLPSDIAVFDDGTGEKLYVAGYLPQFGGVARWDGTTWTGLGGGLTGTTSPFFPVPTVSTLAVHDDGAGPALYAGGNFTHAGGVPAPFCARWDGGNWTAVPTATQVTALEVADGRLYAVHGPSAWMGGVSRLDGMQWTPIEPPSGVVTHLTAHDDGIDEVLVAGGFTTIGGTTTPVHAAWDGVGWHGIGGAFNSTSGGVNVLDVATVNTREGFRLVSSAVLGTSSTATGTVAVWDGSSWTSLAPGVLSNHSISPYPPRVLSVAPLPCGGVLLGGNFRHTPTGATNLVVVDCREPLAGNVGAGWPAPVLAVNGRHDERLSSPWFSPLTITMFPPVANSVPSGFVLAGFIGIPDAGTATAIPGLGELAFPLPHMAPWLSGAFYVTSNVGAIPGALLPSGPAPWSVTVSPPPAPGLTFTLQGVIRDETKASGFAITNGIIVDVVATSAPTIASVTPGSALPGTPVQVRGTGFRPGATVTIGGTPAIVLDLTTSEIGVLAVTAPCDSSLVVTNPDGQTASTVFNATPVILGTAPSALASATGGTLVVLGAFDPASIVSINGAAVATQFTGPAFIAVTAPPAPIGPATLTVTSPTGCSGSSIVIYQ